MNTLLDLLRQPATPRPASPDGSTTPDCFWAEGRLPAGFDERFVALWRYYLMYCEGGFRGGGIDVHQVTLVKAG